MSTALWSVFAATLLGAPFEDAPAIELRYTGALAKVARAADEKPVKRFNLYCLVIREPEGKRTMAYSLGERGGGGWAWPERFGSVSLDQELKPAPGNGIRLLYDYEGTPLVIPLPLPIPAYAGSLKAGAKWSEGKEAWEVARTQKVQDRNCWQVHVATSFGRKRTLWIDAESPLVVALEERVFVGQGDEHALTMQLESAKPLDDEQLARNRQVLPALLELQSALKRSENESRPELTEAQLKLASDALPQLQNASADTPFSPLVAAIHKDVKAQLQRSDEVSKLADKFIGKPAPAFSLTLSDKTEVASDSLKDKITVLHFWEYQGEPLVEPYGQVGYLDFLYGKRRKLGVQVFGVAVDSRIAEDRSSPAALKSIQKLKSFMNLSYPIALDDGKLLARFGDPTKYGAKLPLWIVIGPDGKIAHFRAGFYKINPDEGLNELDELLVKLIREQKSRGDSKDDKKE
ncbi:MAG TPA: redoxin domain-containing protein [Planctomycetaceae bacterium]|nr:redoxin domain-containing protein [Planctomycetaceae bacterium]